MGDCLTKDELIAKLVELAKCNNGDIEMNHSIADDLLLQYINDEDVRAAYNTIDKWYA